MRVAQVLLLLIGGFITLSCGVRGEPQPPQEPAFIGTGSPQIAPIQKGEHE